MIFKHIMRNDKPCVTIDNLQDNMKQRQDKNMITFFLEIFLKIIIVKLDKIVWHELVSYKSFQNETFNY